MSFSVVIVLHDSDRELARAAALDRRAPARAPAADRGGLRIARRRRRRARRGRRRGDRAARQPRLRRGEQRRPRAGAPRRRRVAEPRLRAARRRARARGGGAARVPDELARPAAVERRRNGPAQRRTRCRARSARCCGRCSRRPRALGRCPTAPSRTPADAHGRLGDRGLPWPRRTSPLRPLGPFDPDAFLFYEDLELCLRRGPPGADRAAPEIALRHTGGHSAGRAVALKASRRREVVGASLGARALAIDDAAQALTFLTRAAVGRRRAENVEELRALRAARSD